jgi:integrase
MIVDRKIANIALPAFASTTLLPRLCFHGFASKDFHHAHATRMLSSGVYRKVASEKLGHSKPGITLDLYSGVSMQADAAIVDGAVRAALNKRETKGWQNGSGHPIWWLWHFQRSR